MPERLFIGAMSGTSADAVDAALVAVTGTGAAMRARPLASAAVPFDAALRRTVLGVRDAGHADLRTLAGLTRDVTLAYADAVRRVLAAGGITADAVAAVAAHGQTLFHDPPLTLQQFDPALLAAGVGLDVVSDFRRADCAAGGQGAPLVPFADWVLFRADRPRVLLNLGGIANVTLLPAADDPAGVDGVRGFDVGPANCLSDWLLRDAIAAAPSHGDVRRRDGVGIDVDRMDVSGIDVSGIDVGGRRALAGRADAAAVERFLESDYVRRPPPKSTDGPAMVAAFVRALGTAALSLDDRLATAAAVVAGCVLRQTPAGAPLVVAGGGVHNAAVMRRLAAERAVGTTDALGVPPDTREAVAFALLGAATLDRIPANLPAVTGARRSVVLGTVTPKP